MRVDYKGSSLLHCMKFVVGSARLLFLCDCDSCVLQNFLINYYRCILLPSELCMRDYQRAFCCGKDRSAIRMTVSIPRQRCSSFVNQPSMEQKMAFKALRGIALLLLAVPFNKALTIPSEGSLVDTPAPFINITLPPSPRLNDLSIDCRGSLYGTGLRYDSCLDAFRTFKKGAARNPVQIRRGRGSGRAVHNLPWMWVSGMMICSSSSL